MRPGEVCEYCHLTCGPDEHDPCVRQLPGVVEACCGHGKRFGYVVFSNGCAVYGIQKVEHPARGLSLFMRQYT